MRPALLALALLAFAATAWAESAKPAAPPKSVVRKATRPGSAAKPAAKPAAAAGKAAANRRLDDIHIEGEIPVPQVLFVTAREQRRFMDFQHHRYLKPSTKVGDEAALPTWIAITGNPPVDARKEPSR